LFAACSSTVPAASSESPPRTTPPPIAQVADPVPVRSGPPGDPREAALAQTVVELLEHEHLLHKPIDDTISRQAFATYVDRLDSTKMYLLKADRDSLDKYADKIDDELRAGSLELAHVGEKLLEARIAVVDKLVASLLAAPLDHNDEEWLELDPKKIEPAASEDELRERWRQHLELEILERVDQMEDRLADAAKAKKSPKAADAKPDTTLSQIPATFELREAKARDDLAKSYQARFPRLLHPGSLDAASELLNAVTSTLDPHTDYLPPADKANFDIQMSGSLEGIGAVLREKDHYIEVFELVPGGASWREGHLSAGDLILSVQAEGQDPVDVADMQINDVVKMIRGPKGSVVRLRVKNAAGDEQTIAITRDVVVVEESFARGAVILDKGQSYGYIHLPSFYGTGKRTSAGDVRKLLAELKNRHVRGIIIDIRSNGGGLLSDAVEMTGELIDQGPVVQVQDSRGHRETLADNRPGEDYDGPVVVMIDKFSASASEILAAALQDYHRAVIVGTSATHGKGTVQTLADLDRIAHSPEELGVLKVTIQQFFRVNGGSTQIQGVTPDIVLPDPNGYIDSGEKTLPHAIAWSQIDPTQHDDWPATWKLPELVRKSAARVGKLPVFGKIATSNQILRSRRDDTRVPLALGAWETRRKELRAALEAANPDLEKLPTSLVVKAIDDPEAAVTAPRPGGTNKPEDRTTHWRDNLAHDPWVDECLNVLGDMAK
jgi:carboxyl-terminal processing protease